MAESTQHKLDRVRPPRVQITYDVEIGGAIQKKELPLVVGIMSDLTGATVNAVPLKDRKFVEIDRDNFNEVMKSLAPTASISVANHIDKNASSLPVSLSFQTIEDFTPANLVEQVEGLRKLLASRRRLNDLLAKLDGNDALNSVLLDVVAKPEELKQLKASNTAEEEVTNG
ncbi:type VI secretion system contractile sheath small subunit [Edaphobacter modestus]|uniref:Type VI secretion system protein ImpB n=1 Tax=Edaphobacter modestus TaxID=388466 RepID=A0A4Q7XZA0_9BACT|nr:type VI secretion system contractile sheath small subunit [Edaphobacter modestus]RZU29757.1 type VI secretion system protein ImpB [Edaphobacter modestus]